MKFSVFTGEKKPLYIAWASFHNVNTGQSKYIHGLGSKLIDFLYNNYITFCLSYWILCTVLLNVVRAQY